ncbi:MAG: T9SS type A sorting domain-containing protein [Lentimicrobiaceae bacterium]|nr:T9SS type A sorting domain-containing protein [Lentimicrobiaceae bacterium]
MKNLVVTLFLFFGMLSAYGQWIENQGIPIVTEGTSIYDNKTVVGKDGTTYFLGYCPNLKEAEDEYDTDNVVYEYRLQAIDKNGVRKFGDLGLLISDYPNRSYCVVNDYLYLDKEGNIIVVVFDARAHEYEDLMGAYAYKISPEGEKLWGEDGVLLGNGRDLVAAMRMVELTDGSIVFAWMRSHGQLLAIDLQRITAKGEPQWEPTEVGLNDETITYQYPYLVDAGMNQFILVYAKGGAQDLYARKMDFDGTSVWSEDTRIYRGGWGSIPLWTILDVKPSGDGGVILGWNDDRSMTNIETAYMSYVTKDGEIGFSGASDNGDVKLNYSEFRNFNCKVMADPAGDGFLAFWRETSEGQSWQRMVMQKVSKEGELLYGDEGVMIADFEETNFGYNSIQPGNEGEAALFYMRQNAGYGDVDVLYITFKTETGEFLMEEPHRLIAGTKERSSMTSHVCQEEGFWILKWKEDYKDENNNTQEKHLLYRLDYRVNDTTSVENIITISDNFYHSNEQFMVKVANAGKAQIEIFDLMGRKIDDINNVELNAGLNTIAWTNKSGAYIAKMTVNNEVLNCKILIK